MGHLHSDNHFKTQGENALGASRLRRGAAGPCRAEPRREAGRGGEGREGGPGARGCGAAARGAGERGQQQAGRRARRWARRWARAPGAAAPPRRFSQVRGRLFPRCSDPCAVAARSLPNEPRLCCPKKPSPAKGK